MSVSDKAFTAAISELFERYLVPLIFDPYAMDMARRICSIGANQILETAAGTGVVTRALASALPRSASIVATDLNQAMLDVASSTLGRSLSGSDRQTRWSCPSKITRSMPLRNEILARKPDGLDIATRKASAALARRFGSGPIEGKIQGIIFTAKS